MAAMKLILGAAAAAAALAGGVAAAQDAGEHTPPNWPTLLRCAQMPAEDARLACYDAAMRAAGYTPNAEAVAAEKRKRFGLSFPQVSILKHREKETGEQAAGGAAAPTPSAPSRRGRAPAAETEDEITVELTQVATLQPNNQLVMFTADGAIWEQTDSDQVDPVPKAGDTVRIHKGVIGGFLCDVNKYKSVRCKRER
jgi:hypothetical protein